jgi:hypothetical protein
MKRVNVGVLGLCLASALCTLSFSSEVLSTPSPKLVEGTGTRSAGFFTAGATGAVIALPGSARVELSPGAVARVFPKDQRLRMPEGYLVSTWSVAVKSGRVAARVSKPRKTAVLLTASQKFSTVVASGEGMLIVDQGETGAVNLSGTSHTIIAGRWEALPAQTVRSLAKGQGRHVTEPLLDGTTLLPGKRLWVSTRSGIKLDTFAWKPLEGASHYVVTLRRPNDVNPIANVTTTEPRLNRPLGPVGPGVYELAVHAVDRRGLPGKPSEAVRLRVLGVDLPQGAYVSQSGTIHLGEGQSAHFTHADGLELSYSGASHYVPATSAVPLTDGEPTVVSIRDPNSPDVTITRLHPRNVKADVSLGPYTARWPQDRVQVAVKLKTTNGTPVPDFIEARPRVTIGIEPVDVVWRSDGDVLRATVPPSKNKGPWVVRVEVEDQFGIPLGRNLLEVIPGGASPNKRVAKRQSFLRVSSN